MGPNETRMRARLAGIANMHADWGPKAVDMTREERAGVIMKILDEMDAGLLEVSDRPPHSGQPKTNIRDFVESRK